MILRNWALATFVLIGIVLVGLALTGGSEDQSRPRTNEEKQAVVEKSIADPNHGVYDSEVVGYATAALQGLYGEMANFPAQPVPVDELLTYLTYLAEGSVSRPDQVDWCSRVMPLWAASHKIGDQLFGKEASVQQQDLFERIGSVSVQKADEHACQSGDGSKQQVST